MNFYLLSTATLKFLDLHASKSFESYQQPCELSERSEQFYKLVKRRIRAKAWPNQKGGTFVKILIIHFSICRIWWFLSSFQILCATDFGSFKSSFNISFGFWDFFANLQKAKLELIEVFKIIKIDFTQNLNCRKKSWISTSCLLPPWSFLIYMPPKVLKVINSPVNCPREVNNFTS